jgi:hypothetical protein
LYIFFGISKVDAQGETLSGIRCQGSGKVSSGCAAENQGLGMMLDVPWGFPSSLAQSATKTSDP